LIKALEEDIKITDALFPVSGLIETKKGGNDKSNQGSWIHPDLAQWLSPKFAIQVSRWVRELAATGTVVLGKEKSNEELLNIQKQLTVSRLETKQIENKYNKLLKKRNYDKFKMGAVFYIISDLESGVKKIKPGFEGVNINIRLQ
jgi:hypothetical protein